MIWDKKKKYKEQLDDDGKENDWVATTTTKYFLVVYDDNVVNIACHETSWIVDTRAYIHATSREDFFTSYTVCDFGTVKIGNDGLVKVVGIGDMCLEMNNGPRLLLKGVKHIPKIHLNLISAGKLDDEGYWHTFSNGQWKLTKCSIIFAHGKKYSTLYILQTKLSKGIVNTVKDELTAELL